VGHGQVALPRQPDTVHATVLWLWYADIGTARAGQLYTVSGRRFSDECGWLDCRFLQFR